MTEVLSPSPFTEVTDWNSKPLFKVEPETLPSVSIYTKTETEKYNYDCFCLEELDIRLASVVLATDKTPSETAKEMERVILSTRSIPETTCSICLSNIHGWSKHTPCGHVFHSKCLTKWTNDACKRTCPSCRTDLFPHDQERNRGEQASIDDQLENFVLQWMQDINQEDEQQPPSEEEDDGSECSEYTETEIHSALELESDDEEDTDIEVPDDFQISSGGISIPVHTLSVEEQDFLWELENELNRIFNEDSEDEGSAGFRSESPDSLG